MRLNLRSRRGLALATALAALVLIGALIAGTFFLSMQNYRVGRASLETDRALTVAEYGQNMMLKDWQQTWPANLKVGDTLKQVFTTEAGSADTVVATRIRFNMFWLVSSGHATTGVDGSARRRTGLLVRMSVPQIPFPAAFSSASTSALSGNFTGTGSDATPTTWSDCPPPVDPVAAVASTAVSNITGSGSGCGSFGCLTGDPQRLATPDAADQTKILDHWNDLTARANKVIASSSTPLSPAPSLTGTACNTASTSNWGDPLRASPAGPCESYLPIIHITCSIAGSLCLQGSNLTGGGAPPGKWQTVGGGGRGQGILLVDGNLNIEGGFQWVGPIIVKGNVRTAGTGNKVTGGIHALNIGCILLTCNHLTGTSSIIYSACALDKTLSANAFPTVAKQHAWADMF